MSSGATLGERIRELRRRRALTQVELAGDDFCKSYVSAVERGKIDPSLDALRVLAERLGVSVVDLVSPPASVPIGYRGVEVGPTDGDGLGEWVDRLLLQRGWRQADLAARVGLSQPRLNRILTGAASPSPEVCQCLAEVLGESPVTVFRRAGLLPAVAADQAEAETLLHYFSALSPQSRRLLLVLARAWVDAEHAAARSDREQVEGA